MRTTTARQLLIVRSGQVHVRRLEVFLLYLQLPGYFRNFLLIRSIGQTVDYSGHNLLKKCSEDSETKSNTEGDAISPVIAVSSTKVEIILSFLDERVYSPCLSLNDYDTRELPSFFYTANLSHAGNTLS